MRAVELDMANLSIGGEVGVHEAQRHSERVESFGTARPHGPSGCRLTPQALLSPLGKSRFFLLSPEFPPIRCRKDACELSESA